MRKFLETVFVFCAVAYLCMIFSFWAVVVGLGLLTAGYMVIMLLVALFVVETEYVLDKQNPVADFIRESKKANANRKTTPP